MTNFGSRYFRFAFAFLLFGVGSVCVHAELAVVERWPTGENVCADVPLRLTFNQPPILGNSGKIEVRRISDGVAIATIDLGVPEQADAVSTIGGSKLHYEPVWLEGNSAYVRLPLHSLSPNESYQVRISAGAFKDQTGVEFAGISAGWTFRTKAALSHNPAHLTVAADGSGDCCTVQGAIDQIEPHRHQPAVVFIRKGRYPELIRVPGERTHIHLVGEDRQGTVIACLNNDKLNPGAAQRAILGVEGDDFVLENLTVRNTTPYKGSQAEAVYVNADRCLFRNVNFLSFQDTLCLNGRVYVSDSYIEGDVDYVWGYGSAVLERCELHTMHDGYIVQARNPDSRPGYVFLDCRLTAVPEVKKCWLARIDATKFPVSHVSFIRCAMDAHILPAGWLVTGATKEGLRFEEFAGTDLEGHPLDLSKRDPAGKQTTAEQAAGEEPSKMLGGADGWDPRAEVRKAAGDHTGR